MEPPPEEREWTADDASGRVKPRSKGRRARAAVVLLAIGFVIGRMMSPSRYATINGGGSTFYVVDRLTGAVQFCSRARCFPAERGRLSPTQDIHCS